LNDRPRHERCQHVIKALLFDLDGTLAETNSVHCMAWVEILRPYGYHVTWDLYRDRINGRLTPEIVSDLLPDLSPEETQKMADDKEAAFRERVTTLEPLPGLRDLITRGREKGMGISLVTNAPKENVLAMLRALDLEDAFEPVILAEDLDAGKPDPLPYETALEALGVSAVEAVAFEDSPTGIASSVAAGIPTVGIASTHEPEKLEGLGVDLVVCDFADPKLEAFIEGR
jgi:HAD superfamily hydrolase (TIGR01509 family)